MHLVVVVPSPEHVATAGVRIRYQRLAEEMEARGAIFSIVSFADLAAIDRPPTAAIFCKVYSFAAMGAMARLRAAGVTVAIDIFDDYFSQTGRPDLARYRRWLTAALPQVDIAICSTVTIAALLARLAPAVTIFRLPDTLEPVELSHLRALLTDKLAAARTSGVLKLLWFGIGHNPLFQVGLDDLVATGDHLASLTAEGWTVELQILTNGSSLTPARAAGLARLPVPWQVDAWSVEAENAALEAATIVFLPVNGQEFSRAKTLNRAMTAARAGCQLFSVGHPLYADLYPFVYREADVLIADLATGQLAIRGDNVGPLLQRLSDVGDRIMVARAFIDVLSKRSDGPNAGGDVVPPAPSVAIQGIAADALTDPETLTLRSPISRSRTPCDIHLRPNAAKLRYDVWVAGRVAERMAERDAGLADEMVEKGEMFRLPARYSQAMPTEADLNHKDLGMRPGPYLDAIGICRAIVADILPGATTTILERDGLCNHWLERYSA